MVELRSPENRIVYIVNAIYQTMSTDRLYGLRFLS